MLLKCLSTLGGTAAPHSVRDFTAVGTITYFWAGKTVSGPVIIKGKEFNHFSLEADLPEGKRTIVLNQGEGRVTEPNGQTTKLPFHSAVTSAVPILPQLLLASILKDSSSEIGLVDSTSLNGNVVFQVRVQPGLGPAKKNAKDLFTKTVFLDSTDSKIVKISDTTHPVETFLRSLNHEFDFDDYQSFEGVLVPTLIRETIDHDIVSEIRLKSISFNSGLADQAFSMQQGL